MGLLSSLGITGFGAPALVSREARAANDAGDDEANLVLRMARVTGTEVESEIEAAYFEAFLRLLAMCAAHLHDDVRQARSLSVVAELESRYGPRAGKYFKLRCISYLAAVDRDIADEKLDHLPTLLTQALERICGIADESVLTLRMLLLQTTLPTVRQHTEYYRTLRII